jgi:hypothetical protein
MLQSNKGLKMTPSELKYQHESHNPESFYFTRKTMSFFGDTMKNYGVRSHCENTWELYRKTPVKHGLTNSAYFSKLDFKKVSNHA